MICCHNVLQAHANFFHIMNIQGEISTEVIFVYNMFNIGLQLDAYELIVNYAARCHWFVPWFLFKVTTT